MKTTDPQDEIFPIINEDDKVVGKMTRKVAHKSPHLIHRAIAVLVLDRKGNLLIHKRSMTKDMCPGYWQYSVGGHVGYEEEYIHAVIKEVKEELGIKISKDSLEFLGKTLTVTSQEQEMIQVYEYIVSDKMEFKPSKEEIAEIKFVNKKTLMDMLTKEKWTPSSLQILPKFFL